jgi:hypothetical protein
VLYRQWQGLSTDLEDFDDDALTEARERVAELEIFMEGEKKVEVEKPEKLKNAEKFHEFYERLEHYLSRIRSSCDVPLIWRCCEHTKVTEERLEEECESRDAYFMATMLLEGPRYLEDNKKLFDILLELTAGTTADAYVKPFEKKRDRLKAFISLKQLCGGPATIEARSARAHKVIDTLKYDGTKKNFTITDYNARQLAKFPQRRQVTFYLRGIRHPELKSGVSYCRETLKNDFKAATQHMAEEEMALQNDKPPSQHKRGISQAGRGRNGGRGGRNGRGGRGGRRGRGGGRLSTRPRTNAEWKALPVDERGDNKRRRRSARLLPHRPTRLKTSRTSRLASASVVMRTRRRSAVDSSTPPAVSLHCRWAPRTGEA